MRGVAVYILAAAMLVSTMEFVVPSAGLGPSVSAWPTPAPEASTLHQVNRTNKGDRFDTTRTVLDRSDAPRQPSPVAIGCQPAFSPLIDPEHAQTYNSRCVVAEGNPSRIRAKA